MSYRGPHTELTKMKISMKNAGRKLSDEDSKRKSLAQLGRKDSDETREKKRLAILSWWQIHRRVMAGPEEK